jgi:heme exporter protein D
VSEFFAMGGYAAYVWPAYGVAALVLIMLLVHSWRSARRRAAELEQLRHLGRPTRPRRATLRSPPAGAAVAPTELRRQASE